mmetsp:Transcript_15794/g.40086  ORF Transcript_15794/g.40086 Transcript_15794/m.40086 type:complete len:137 (-) Transcript_15794:271-681(-)
MRAQVVKMMLDIENLKAGGSIASSNTECDRGFFGVNCSACNCTNRGICDDGTNGSGRCACFEGMTGDRCERCAPGYCGKNCTKSLDCKEVSCLDGGASAQCTQVQHTFRFTGSVQYFVVPVTAYYFRLRCKRWVRV